MCHKRNVQVIDCTTYCFFTYCFDSGKRFTSQHQLNRQEINLLLTIALHAADNANFAQPKEMVSERERTGASEPVPASRCPRECGRAIELRREMAAKTKIETQSRG
eukprot:2416737-Pleurochrysis_carterae.AAC.1